MQYLTKVMGYLENPELSNNEEVLKYLKHISAVIINHSYLHLYTL